MRKSVVTCAAVLSTLIPFLSASAALASAPALSAKTRTRVAAFRAHAPIHVRGLAAAKPAGLSPDQIKAAYDLPADGGHGTIAIIDAYDDATIEKDLGTFSTQFGLPACTVANTCLEKHKMATTVATNAGWALETSLDVEWAHAIAPRAKILLVEAKTSSGTNLMNAVDYAAARTDVVAVSMSWGGAEYSGEQELDSHFVSVNGATFFASSGDDGTGASWPASSPNVVGVGGTTLNFGASGAVSSETAWSGSGGGVSAYETQPAYQAAYSIARAKGMRALPDVSFDADPQSGFSVVRSSSAKAAGKWYVVGGTSAGAPQWAAIASLGSGANDARFYQDKASAGDSAFFRDIKSGSNGDCVYFCTARAHYDYVTGLGSPLTTDF
jgi:subtilase family serine protease